MSFVDWDADDFEVTPAQPLPKKQTDKWEGEDEDDDVKDNWDDDDEEEEEEIGSGEPKQEETTVNSGPDVNSVKKKKKKLSAIIAEKEAKRAEEVEQKKQLQEKVAVTPEEQLAEKLRLQKIQEDNDVLLMSELIDPSSNLKEKQTISLDSVDISTAEGLEEFRVGLIKKIQLAGDIEKRVYYILFIEDLCRDLCKTLDSENIKRVTSVLNALYNEKMKASKVSKGKKKGSKAQLNVDRGNDFFDCTSSRDLDTYDDYDDFM